MLQGHGKKVYRHSIMADYIDVAENPDWEHGKVRKELLTEEKDAIVKMVLSSRKPKLSARLVIEKKKFD